MRVFVAVEPELCARLGLVTMQGVDDSLYWDPSWDPARVERAVAGSDIIVTSWRGPQLNLGTWTDEWRLRLVIHAGGSIRHLVPASCISDGLQVSTTNGVLAASVAEFAVGAILASLRGILDEGARYRRTRRFDEERSMALGNRELRSATVGIVGLGAIGSRVVDLLSPFGPTLIAHDPSHDSTQWADRGVELVTMAELAGRSDVLTLHAALNSHTTGLVDSSVLALLPDGATLVNTARGALVNQAALERELRSGRIRAVLDVTDPDEPLSADSPLFAMDNCWVTPHIGSSTRDTLRRQGHVVEAEIIRFAGGRPLAHRVSASAAATRA